VQTFFFGILTAMIGLGTLLTTSAGTSTPALECPGIGVQVNAGSAADRVRICTGAERAVAFLRSHGLETIDSIQVTLSDSAIANHGAHIGLYDASSRTVRFLSFKQAVAQCEKQSPFRTPMDEALYTSFATHEIAHAIVEQHIKPASNRRIAHEYIAYVAQIATMPAEKRLAILQNYDISAFEGPENMSLIYYGLDPNAFGVKSYKHFQKLPDQTAFLRALLSGKIRTGGSRWDRY